MPDMISIIHNRGARIGHQINNYFDILGYCSENNINFQYSEFAGNSRHWNDVLKFYKIHKEENLESKITHFDFNKVVNFKRPKAKTLFKLYDEHRQSLFVEYQSRNPYETKSNICIHIRRGDVNKNNHPGRFLTLDYYEKILSSIYKNQKVYILSESNLEEDLDVFQEYNPIILKDISDVDSFYYMVNSDILICSKGGFSHLAHILGHSKCYYPKHWCLYREDAMPLEV